MPASHGELVVIGDFDAPAISGQVEKLFGGWVSKKPYTRLVGKPFAGPGAMKSIDIKDKEMTQLVGAQGLAMKDTDPDYPAWIMVGQILGGDAGSRLWMRLREHEGLSYGTAAWTFAGSLDDAGGFGAEAIVAPQNPFAKAKASMLDEISKITRPARITDEELARSKDAWLKSQDTNLSNDGYLGVDAEWRAILGKPHDPVHQGATRQGPGGHHRRCRACRRKTYSCTPISWCWSTPATRPRPSSTDAGGTLRRALGPPLLGSVDLRTLARVSPRAASGGAAGTATGHAGDLGTRAGRAAPSDGRAGGRCDSVDPGVRHAERCGAGRQRCRPYQAGRAREAGCRARAARHRR